MGHTKKKTSVWKGQCLLGIFHELFLRTSFVPKAMKRFLPFPKSIHWKKNDLIFSENYLHVSPRSPKTWKSFFLWLAPIKCLWLEYCPHVQRRFALVDVKILSMAYSVTVCTQFRYRVNEDLAIVDRCIGQVDRYFAMSDQCINWVTGDFAI